jgi:hypothetical protein
MRLKPTQNGNVAAGGILSAKKQAAVVTIDPITNTRWPEMSKTARIIKKTPTVTPTNSD